MQLVHFGSTEFDKTKFNPIKNKEGFINKPSGGLWTTPLNSNYGWREYCISNNFKLDSLREFFIVSLKENAKLLVIDNADILEELPLLVENILSFIYNNRPHCLLDFEELAKNYDAIWLTEKGCRETHNLFSPLNLHGWDYESVLIMNPDCIITTQDLIEKYKQLIDNKNPDFPMVVESKTIGGHQHPSSYDLYAPRQVFGSHTTYIFNNGTRLYRKYDSALWDKHDRKQIEEWDISWV